MFFQIGNKSLDNFPTNYQHNNLYVNLDHGWTQSHDEHNNVIFYKGYIDNGKIEDLVLDIAKQEEPQVTGSFCLIKCFNNGITVKTDRFRSFPLWYNNNGISNFENIGEPIHTDSFVMLDNNLKKIESKFVLFEHKVIDTKLNFEECVTRVDTILSNKILNFFKFNTQPVHVFLTGGIDTTTLYSYILKYQIPHKLINYLHTDLDYFYLKNHYTLSTFWGFRQIHYWSDPCLLVSGAPGDEFTVRSPTTANMLLRYYGTGIDVELDNFVDSLHYAYFLKYKSLFESQKNYSPGSLNNVVNECINIICNDYQHWHLGNTLCYTPLRDIEIFTAIASLNKQDLINQIFNSTVQKEIIKRNAPQLLDCLSNNKNTKNFFENLTNILPVQKHG